MDTPRADESADLRHYLGILKSRKWTILVVTAVVIAAALLLSYRQTPLYRAEARVLVNPLPSAIVTTVPNQLAAPVNLQTEKEVVASVPVAQLVAEELDVADPTELLDDLEVEALADTEVLVVTYTSPDARIAARAANSFAENYIRFRVRQALESVITTRSSVEDRIDATRDNLEGLAERIERARKAEDDALVSTLETERTALVARLGVLQERLEGVQTEDSVRLAAGDVIEPATRPAAPSSPDHVVNGLLAAIAGVVLGTGLAFFRERLDDKFRGRADIERALEAPVLAAVPKFRPGKGASAKPFELMVAAEPKGTASEAYRTLRTSVQFIASQQGIRSLLITSPSAGEGKTSTTSNLGAALAQAGKRVILLSADMRRPTLERFFGVRNRHGLSTWLLGEDVDDDPMSLLQDSDVPNLRILACGPVPSNPAELLASPRLARLLNELELNADMVLVDSPPVLPVADAAILASHVGGSILVVDAAASHRSATLHAKEALERVGTGVIGTVLNAFDPGTSPYDYYYPYYRRYHSYESAPGNGERRDDGAGEERRERSRIAGLFRR